MLSFISFVEQISNSYWHFDTEGMCLIWLHWNVYTFLGPRGQKCSISHHSPTLKPITRIILCSGHCCLGWMYLTELPWIQTTAPQCEVNTTLTVLLTNWHSSKPPSNQTKSTVGSCPCWELMMNIRSGMLYLSATSNKKSHNLRWLHFKHCERLRLIHHHSSSYLSYSVFSSGTFFFFLNAVSGKWVCN